MAGDDARWELLNVFAEHAFERDEKVGLVVDAARSPAGRVGSRSVGQLSVITVRI